MSAKLVAYQYVPPGFETVIKSPDVEMGKNWNLWWNITLSDDPETWDGEVKAINKMQVSLGTLTVNQRLIRAQMAEFCRRHPLFPQSIDILCTEIGSGRFSKPVKMGCEGRGLLDSLGYHDSQSLNDQQRETLEEYAEAFKKWLAQGHPQNATDSKVFGFLGQSTDNKVAFVKKLVSALNPKDPSMSSIKGLCAEECRKTYGEKLFDAAAQPFHCFNCEGASLETLQCQCCPSMFIDAGLTCTGTFGEERSEYEYYVFIQENILVYAMAINSWLKGASPQDVKWSTDGRYVTRDNSLEIAEKIHSSLGEKNEAKEWLAACLLKTIKDNQRWHKRTELIDGFPEATSWFREMPQA